MADKNKITILFEDGKTLEQGFNELKDIILFGTAQGIVNAERKLSVLSVSKYMINAGGLSASLKAKVHPTILTIRSGRLKDSVMRKVRFTAKVPKVKGLKLKDEFKDIGGNVEGSFKLEYNSMTKKITGIKTSDVPYAGKHEYGEGVRPRPFFEPPLQEINPEIPIIIEDAMGEAIQKTGWK